MFCFLYPSNSTVSLLKMPRGRRSEESLPRPRSNVGSRISGSSIPPDGALTGSTKVSPVQLAGAFAPVVVGQSSTNTNETSIDGPAIRNSTANSSDTYGPHVHIGAGAYGQAGNLESFNATSARSTPSSLDFKNDNISEKTPINSLASDVSNLKKMPEVSNSGDVLSSRGPISVIASSIPKAGIHNNVSGAVGVKPGSLTSLLSQLGFKSDGSHVNIPANAAYSTNWAHVLDKAGLSGTQALSSESTVDGRHLNELLTRERGLRIISEHRLDEATRRTEELGQQLEEEQMARRAAEQRVQDLTRQLQEKEQRIHELEGTLEVAQRSLEESRHSEPCDWVLDRSEITISDNIVGVGAWGRVLEGSFRKSTVAVKQIHELILSPHNRRLFEREMSIASRCRHPCLLQFIGATNDDLSPLFVTELLETSLRALLHERALSQGEIKTLGLDVARALNYLHENSPMPIIHRDISSANVLLWRQSDSWRAKVSDYGTANFMHNTMTASPGAVVYSPPEAHTSRQSPKLDVYSYGVLLCEMNIREFPDPQLRDQQVAMVTSHMYRDLIRRCLQEQYELRPSMAEVIDFIFQ